MYLDIHAHFADEGYTFPDEWNAIRSAGVEKVVLAGDTVAHSAAHRKFCAEHVGAYFCAGVHPSETDGFGEREQDALRALCADEKCVAVGEIGLDYHYPDTDKTAQRKAFTAQLELADELALPVQIHSRDCAEDMLAVLREMRGYLKRGFLLHCYSHGREMMDEFLSLGAYFSFGGVACFKNAKKVVGCVAYCPENRILSETDSPYLSPFRGEKNTPANIPVVVRRLAEIRDTSVENLCGAIGRNALALFPKLK